MISPRGEYGGYNGSPERRIARGQCGGRDLRMGESRWIGMKEIYGTLNSHDTKLPNDFPRANQKELSMDDYE